MERVPFGEQASLVIAQHRVHIGYMQHMLCSISECVGSLTAVYTLALLLLLYIRS